MKRAIIKPNDSLKGTIHIPGDKSISHRAVMFSALSQGDSILKGLLSGEDVLATIACFQAMGVSMEWRGVDLHVHGVGLNGLTAPARVLDCGNSGTTMRLMLGILAGQPFASRLTGDASLNRRPMGRVIAPLKEMGAYIEEMRASETERVLRVEGRPLIAIQYALPMPSAQVKSAVLLAGLFAKGITKVIESIPSRNHTELMLRHRGAEIECNQLNITLTAGSPLLARDLEIPGDISSAAFFLVGGLLGQDSDILLKNVGLNPTRTGIVEVLRSMGGQLAELESREMGGEKVADLRVQASTLRGAVISGPIIPRLIDEIPILSVAAAMAVGKSEIKDAAELRVKESDRICTIVEQIGSMFNNISELEDGLCIGGAKRPQGGTFNSGGDHRIAMSVAIAAYLADRESIIEDVDCIETSYPQFWEHFQKLGGFVELV